MKGRKLNVVRIIWTGIILFCLWIFCKSVVFAQSCPSWQSYSQAQWHCVNSYDQIVFLNYDWTVLQKIAEQYYKPTTSDYNGEIPIRNDIPNCVFNGWTYTGNKCYVGSNYGYNANNFLYRSCSNYAATFFCWMIVTYKYWDVTLWTQEINYWETINMPSILLEWQIVSWSYRDKNLTIPFDLYNEVITWDLDIYLVLWCDNWYHKNWEYCEINEINYWDGNNLYMTQYGIASPLEIGEITKEWYVFAWWYSNPNWTIPYNFNITVTENLNLYAKWERCPNWYSAVNNKCMSDDAWVYYEDGYIVITDGESTYYIKDRNQWAEYSLREKPSKLQLLSDLNNECTIDSRCQNVNNCSQAEAYDYNPCKPICYKNIICPEGYLEQASQIIWHEVESYDEVQDFMNNYDRYEDSDYLSSFGTYYYRWNNNWATRNQLWINWNSATPSQSVINGWFDGWVMWQDSWWINLENDPCDSSKWEYLPTVEDWKNVIEIWSEIKGYDIDWYDGSDHWYIYYDPSFLNDILVPNAWYIKYEAAVKEKAVKNISLRNILLSLFASPVMAEYQGSWSYISFYQNPFLWTALNSGHMMWTLHDNEYDYEHIDITKYNYWYNAIAAPVRCFKRTPLEPSSYVAPVEEEEFEVTVWWETYTWVEEKMIITTNNVVEEIDEIEEQENKVFVWEVKVKFINKENETAKFNKLVQVNVPVSKDNKVIVKVKHAWSNVYNYDWLTRNRNASCDSNWRVLNVKDRYNWETIRVVDGFATIYTCEASSFIALGLWEWESLGEVTLTLTAWENTCTLNDYNLGTHNVSSEDQNVSTSWQDMVCEFLKNPWATIQLSMWDLADWTKEIWRQYFTWIVTSLWNPLWTIANLTWWSYNFSLGHIIYTKEANTIWTWTWSLSIEWSIPAWTPGGQYTWELNVIICEGC